MNIRLSFVRTSVRREESEEYSVEAGDELTCHIAMLLETLVSARACLTNCAAGTCVHDQLQERHERMPVHHHHRGRKQVTSFYPNGS
jgi:hypothetical protein